ncbi:MAG: ABC transporter permease [bacterium]|nr:ABC transporter permease [bacterium]
MDLLVDGFRQAVLLIVTRDPEVAGITLLTLRVSGTATLFALALGLPVGLALGLRQFPGRNLLLGLVNTGMGLPPVVVGLFVALLLWRTGPLGSLGLMYSPPAMILAQFVIAFPIIAGLTAAAMQQLDPRIRLQSLALGASGSQALWTMLGEARLPLLAAVMAGFGGALSEVGAVMIVGGNLKGLTRVLTTATVMEVRMGRFETAIALGLILLGLSFAVNLLLTMLQQGGTGRWSLRPLQ